MTRPIYTTYDEAIAREIVDPIETSDTVENAYDEYDVEAIADAVLETVDGYDELTGKVNVNRRGFRNAVTPEEFWGIVEACARDAGSPQVDAGAVLPPRSTGAQKAETGRGPR